MLSRTAVLDKVLEVKTDNVNITVSREVPRYLISEDEVSDISVIGAVPKVVKINGNDCSPDTDGARLASFFWNVRVCPLFFEQTNYIFNIEGKRGKCVSVWHESASVRKSLAYKNESKQCICGTVNFDSGIGYSDFEISVDGKPHLTLRIEVYPTKMLYRDEYKNIFSEVSGKAFRMGKRIIEETYQAVMEGKVLWPAERVFTKEMSDAFSDFKRALHKVISEPTYAKAPQESVISEKSRAYGKTVEKWTLEPPEYLKALKKEEQNSERTEYLYTYNTPENRFAKLVASKAYWLIQDFERKYINSGKPLSDKLLISLRSMKELLGEIVSSSFLSKVEQYEIEPGISAVFEMDNAYRELFKSYLMFKRAAIITASLVSVSAREIAQLYEYDCYFRFLAIMNRRCSLEASEGFSVTSSGVSASFNKGESTALDFLSKDSGSRFTVIYTQGDALTAKDSKATKYRYLFKANALREKGRFESVLYGAALSKEDEKKKEYEDKSLEDTDIGEIPFFSEAAAYTEDFIKELYFGGAEIAELTREEEEALSKSDFGVKDVLVGSISSEEQLAVSLEKCFYHVPAKYMPKSEHEIKRIVIYQSAFKSDPGIRYYADVISQKVVKRSEIPIPSKRNNGNEDYILFKVGKWQTLNKLIDHSTYLVKKPMLTCNFLFENSDSAYQLFYTKSHEEYRVRRGLNRMLGRAYEKGSYDISGAVKKNGGTIKIINQDGKVIFKMPMSVFKDFITNEQAEAERRQI